AKDGLSSSEKMQLAQQLAFFGLSVKGGMPRGSKPGERPVNLYEENARQVRGEPAGAPREVPGSGSAPRLLRESELPASSLRAADEVIAARTNQYDTFDGSPSVRLGIAEYLNAPSPGPKITHEQMIMNAADNLLVKGDGVTFKAGVQKDAKG